MQIIETPLPGVIIFEPKIFHDDRGYFFETFQENRYRDGGVDLPFVQDNFSRSRYGTLRGLHYQWPHAQGKLVGVSAGNVFDVIVDIRLGSATFGKAIWLELSDENHRQVYIPPGFAHGFCVLSAMADFVYKCTDYYHPEFELGIHWQDTDLQIPWPNLQPLLSAKDAELPLLKNIPKDELPA